MISTFQMRSRETLDFDAVLAPIGERQAATTPVKYAGAHAAVRAARRLAAGASSGTAQWVQVIELAEHALQTECKDLQLAAWLTEALVKVHGFAGLRDGVRLLRELQERFWRTIHPQLDDGGLAARAVLLEWLKSILPDEIGGIPLAGVTSGHRTPPGFASGEGAAG